MRERWVRIVAAITGIVVVLLALVFARLQNPMTRSAEPVRNEDALVGAGRALYEAQGCPMCHSVAGEGNPRYPLDGVGRRRTADAIRAWIIAGEAIRDGLPDRAARAKEAYRALSEEELDALVGYLQSVRE